MITQERLKGNWNQVAGAVKEKFGQISGDELKRVNGNLDQLVGLIQQKTGKSREQVAEFLNSCCSSAESSYNRISEKATEYAEAAGEAVRENYDRAVQSAQRGYEQTVQTVSRKPLESLAVAVGLGMLTGLVVGLSMSSRRR